MSVTVMAWVWAHGPASQSERLVLLAIADHADDDGRAFPGMAKIAAKACCSERGARGVIRRLEEAGWLRTERGGGRGGTSVYHVLMQPINPAAETVNEVPVKENPERETRNEAVKTRNVAAETRNVRSAEPSITIKEPSESSNPPPPHILLSEVVRADTAKDFAAHRKAMRKPLTPEAAKRLVAKLRNHPDPDAVLDLSIENGWQGVFPEKVNGGFHGNPSRPDPLAEQIATAAKLRRSSG